MADHQDAAAIARQLDQLMAFEQLQRQGLFDEDVLARQQRAAHMLGVERGGRSDGDGVALGIVQDRFERRARNRMERGGFSERIGRDIGDSVEGAEFRQVPGDFLAPISTPIQATRAAGRSLGA